jgi:hypothetical protein
MTEKRVRKLVLLAFVNAVAIAATTPARAWFWNRPNSRPSPYQMPAEARPLRQAPRQGYPDYWNGHPPKRMDEYARRQPSFDPLNPVIDPPSTAHPWGTDRHMRDDELTVLNGLIEPGSFRRENGYRYGRFAQRQSRRAIRRLGQPAYRDSQYDWFRARGRDGAERYVRLTYDSQGYAVEAESAPSAGYRPRPETRDESLTRAVRQFADSWRWSGGQP